MKKHKIEKGNKMFFFKSIFYCIAIFGFGNDLAAGEKVEKINLGDGQKSSKKEEKCMHLVRREEAQKFQNGDSCLAYEYPMDEKDINGAIVKLTGRYPDSGRVTNLKCKELSYVVSGSGKVVIDDKVIFLSEGDLVLIDINEKYFWEGNMTLFVSSAPSWSIEQHQIVQ